MPDDGITPDKSAPFGFFAGSLLSIVMEYERLIAINLFSECLFSFVGKNSAKSASAIILISVKFY